LGVAATFLSIALPRSALILLLVDVAVAPFAGAVFIFVTNADAPLAGEGVRRAVIRFTLGVVVAGLAFGDAGRLVAFATTLPPIITLFADVSLLGKARLDA